jgi:glyoxylate/hydroxypyruvate reductase A
LVILVKSGGEEAMPEWRAAFGEIAPLLDVRWWEDPSVDDDEVRYVLCWEPQAGRLARYRNLQLICSSGAGVDHITCDPDWPRHIPIVRMGAADTVRQMTEYVALGALSLLRDARRMFLAQAEGRWDDTIPPRMADETRVGVMGLGNLGAPAAAMLRNIGFITAGWSRTRKEMPGIESFAGAEELDAFLARTDILVCLLPDTAQTRGLIDARLLSKLPHGAGLINAGRGAHVVLDDLIDALDSSHLSGAILDVFVQEPLPPGHPAWTHPRITVTPHIASLPSRQARAAYVAEAIAAFERGDVLPNRYDPERGY